MPTRLRRRLSRIGPLQWAFGVSLAFHLVLLGMHLGLRPGALRGFATPPLSVILVNRASARAPRHAQALAQVDLAGGGGARHALAATPLPAATRNQAGDAATNARRSPQHDTRPPRERTRPAQVQVITLVQPGRQGLAAPARASAQAQSRRMLDVVGAIERHIELQNTQPRRRVVGPDTRSVPYALYYDRMREKIERLGTLDFPEHDGRKLYGRLVMAITLDSRGRVLQASVARGSGDARLDRMAQAIVLGAQPFGSFSRPMLQQADQMVVVAGFDFTREDGLHTEMRAAAPPSTETPR